MIFLGFACMMFFIRELLSVGTDSPALYWLLLLTLIFLCLKILHEWVHYLFITIPETPTVKQNLTVDVFTTFCAGEPYDMITDTLIAIKAITYPHETYLCDEADDPLLKKLCAELGIHHVTRKLKIDAKAGNINNALKISSGELCLVLDPDHVPFPDFLDTVVPHFNDPKIGFVQVVQSYKNQNQTLIAKGAAQQTYQFYGPMMMTMNKYGTVLAIGANCTFRRSALNSIGGHAAGLAEDMHTAMQLHAKGWKSKYIPLVAARGLVPVTLSAYYSQQLKWSRGVFELLVTSYPKLFKSFTWQQKIHYGTIPIFYLSGIFYLINFLIPVLSLVLDTSPINMDFTKFFTLGLPFATSIILIRHFVQQWVIEKEERGFHLVGGLLVIGTWWIYLLGLYYTLLRKTVAYIPTPKDGNEDNNWGLNIPNLLVIIISLIAITYGLYQDYNPYNLVMAGFAGLNCLILLFTIVASKQPHFRTYKEKHPLLWFFMVRLATFKKHFWKVRRQIYGLIRRVALLLVLLIVAFSVYETFPIFETTGTTTDAPNRKNILIAGIFSPTDADGLSNIKAIKEISTKSALHFGIVSLYLSWGDHGNGELPKQLIDSIYHENAVPMITWEPWQSLFEQNKGKDPNQIEKKVFSNILKGEYDQYLHSFSKEIGALNRPVFIRFAHETDNPQYPWSAQGENTPEEFIAAWKYIHDYFLQNQVNNVIWVWNPWKPEAVAQYFPGKAYVDWIGVTNLNYADQNPDRKSYSMQQLYQPFHDQELFTSGIPIMLAEMGSLREGSNQEKWFTHAFKQIEAQFDEIKAVVFFNSGNDKNTIAPGTTSPLDWRVQNFNRIANALNNDKKHSNWLANQLLAEPISNHGHRSNAPTPINLTLLKGVNYMKDQNWKISYKHLKVSEISADFTEMKKVGFNTIQHYGPNIYDRNILGIAKQKELKVIYSFWLPNDLNYLADTALLSEYTDKVLETVKKLKDNRSITMWTLSNTNLEQMKERFYSPDFMYLKKAYLSWLNQLSYAIKQEDPMRPLSMDINLSPSVYQETQTIHKIIPSIDNFGLLSGKDTVITLPKLALPYYLNDIRTDQYILLQPQAGVVIKNWQDQRIKNYVSYDGLKDMYGNYKPVFFQLGDYWNKTNTHVPFPVIKILKPATTLVEDNLVTYSLINLVNGEWKIMKKQDDLKLIWQLVKKDQYGNTLDMKKLDEGPQLTLTIPHNPSRYRLYVYVIRGKEVKIIKSRLNTPLH